MMDALTADVWLALLGRAHPVVLHLPFGVFMTLVVLELWGRLRKRPLERGMRSLLATVLLLSTALAATTGWFLGESPDYGGETVEWHRNLGVATGVLGVVVAIAAWTGLRRVYAFALGAGLVTLAAAGHLGGELTHGEGFLLEPVFDALDAARDGDGSAGSDGGAAQSARRGAMTAIGGGADDAARSPELLAAAAQAAFADVCTSCHRADRKKAGLALDDLDAVLAGSRRGPIVTVGDAEASELVRRMRLPLQDEDHMPPAIEPQPTPEQVDAIVAWIDAGAPGATAPGSAEEGDGGGAPVGSGAGDADGEVAPSSQSLLLDRLRGGGGTDDDDRGDADGASGASGASDGDDTDGANDGANAGSGSGADAGSANDGAAAGGTAAAADVSPAAAALLDPALAETIGALRARQAHVETADPATGALWLDLRAVAGVGDADVTTLDPALAAHVTDLSLRDTAVGDASLAALAAWPALEKLDVAGTRVSTAGLFALAGAASLSVLDLTRTAVDDGAVAVLARLPALERVYLWDTRVSADGVARLRERRPALVVEDGRALFSDALESEPAVELRELPAPVNSMCPVSGDDVDAWVTREHDGAVVGFCCGDCRATFAADPAAFEVVRAGPRLGAGEHVYEWVPGWLQLPEGLAELGNTHGEIVVDRAGQLHLNTDTERAIMVFAPDGRFARAWGAEFANGLHGMHLVEEGGVEFLYFVHFNRHEVVKATLEGEIVWRMGHPEASGKYEHAEQFRPTSIAVAPDGGFFVADGYGEQWVHQYDAARNWVRAIGGPGSEPGRFATPHGVWVDTRGAEPVLLVADRENHRLQRFDMEGRLLGVVEGMLRRPCKIQQRGEYLVVPDLAGRVTILDGDDALVTHLGDNPDPARRANNGVPREHWADGEFLAPHSAAWDAEGHLYVMDWNRHGRITKLRRVRG